MRLLIKQKVFSIKDSFNVYDENENVKYTVKGEFFSLGKKLHVYDAEGNEIGMIRQKVLAWLPKFIVEIGGQQVGMIRKGFTFFIDKYDVDYKGWTVQGDLLDWDYSVYQGSERVLDIQKKILSWGDTYMIDIMNPQDEIPAIMLVLAIDAVKDAERTAAASSSSN